MKAAVLAVVAAAGCVRHHRLAAPPPPPQTLAITPSGGTPGPGLGRVLLDVQEGPAVVERVHGASAAGAMGAHAIAGSFELAQRVCVTPCVLDLPKGPQQLRFTLVDDDERMSNGYVNVDDRVAAYRHAIGTQRNDRWKGFVGWPILLLGAVLDLGFGTVAAKGELEDRPGTYVGVGVAVGLTVLGGWLVAGSVVEQQPGSGVQWNP